MSTADETPEEAFERNLRRIQTEGLDAAVNASLDLMRDKNAPAQARSAALNATYRASGLFNRRDDDGEDGAGTPSLEDIKTALEELRALKSSVGEDKGIFG